VECSTCTVLRQGAVCMSDKGDDETALDDSCAQLATQLALAQARAAELADLMEVSRRTEEALRDTEAQLRSKLAEVTADLRLSRLESSRLRGCVLTEPQALLFTADVSNVQVRVQAAVQASLRAERWATSQRLVCAVCLEREKDCALGCGHVFCRQCAWRLTICALCRAGVAVRIHLY
jgi:hypothetical protein